MFTNYFKIKGGFNMMKDLLNLQDYECQDGQESDYIGQVYSELKEIKRKIHKMKRKKKKKHGKKKKIKREIKKLEMKQEQMKQVLVYMGYCFKDYPKHQSIWWQEALTNSLPKALDFASAVMYRLPEKKRELLPDKSEKN